jgi:copper homeostasis protein
MLLEIACFNLESAVIAQRAGADRIEFCSDYSVGGVTPSFEEIAVARKQISIPLFVMIHLRIGEYVYTHSEIEEMKEAILFCKASGIDGVVFGILDADGNVDTEKCKELVALASPMKTTFHRAFDVVKNPTDAIEDIIACGFSRILTSGQKPSALAGADLISSLIRKAKDRIIILPGGGIRSSNISEIKEKTGAKEFHSAALNTETMIADENEIRKLKSILR